MDCTEEPPQPSPSSSAEVTEEGAFATHAAAFARAYLIGKLVLLPKFKLKAAGMFQPEDHASRVSARLARTRFGRVGANVLNYGGIYVSGVLLFSTHTTVLRHLNHGADSVSEDVPDAEAAASEHAPSSVVLSGAAKSAVAGGAGGAMYALSSTPLVGLLRAGPPSTTARETSAQWAVRVVGRPLRYTLARDCGGFAFFFGTYSACRAGWAWRVEPTPPEPPPRESAHVHTAVVAPAAEGAPASASMQEAAATLASNLASALVSGTAAGVATYLWRSPWDTLYKKHMGWRPADAPLLSPARFVTSPRGLKAVAISGATWTAYEAVLALVSAATEQGLLSAAPTSEAKKGQVGGPS